MKIIELTFSKELVTNLGNYNSIRTSYGKKIQITKEENKPEKLLKIKEEQWDDINQQLDIQGGSTDQSWMIPKNENSKTT